MFSELPEQAEALANVQENHRGERTLAVFVPLADARRLRNVLLAGSGVCGGYGRELVDLMDRAILKEVAS